MEPLAIISTAGMFLGLASLFLDSTPNDEWRQIPWERDTCFIQVFEASWVEEIDCSVLVDINKQRLSGEQLGAVFQAMPAQKPGSCRVYFEENVKHKKEFQTHIGQLLPDTSAEHYSTDLKTPSFATLRSQWISQNSSLAWFSRSYDMSDITKNKLFNQRSLRSSLLFSAGLMRFSKSVRVVESDHGRVLIFISNQSERINLDDLFSDYSEDKAITAPLRPCQVDVCFNLSQFCAFFRGSLMAKSFRNIIAGTNSHQAIIQLVLLVFCQCNLGQLSNFIDTTRVTYTLFQERATDPRRTIITKSLLQGIIRDAYFYNQLQDCVSDLTSIISPLLELLDINFAAKPDFKYLAAEMRATCIDLTKSSTRLSTRIDSHLRQFELLRSFNESLSVWLLGLLASIFLPLSLASSLLSMQSRLAELHFILYDFCGVIVLLGTIVLFIVILIRVYTRLNERLVKLNRNTAFRKWIYPFVRISAWTLSFITWGLLVSSFLVGMIEGVGLGLLILGYGAAVIAGFLVLAALGGTLMWMLIKRL